MVTKLRYCARNITGEYLSVRSPRGPYALTRAQPDLTISNAGIPNNNNKKKGAYDEHIRSRAYVAQLHLQDNRNSQ